MADAPSVTKSLEFDFTSDRYGFRPVAAGDVESKRAVIDAMDRWAGVVASLFGDVTIALEDAGEAGILPRHPAWPAIDAMRSTAKTQLLLVEEAIAEVSRARSIVGRPRERTNGKRATSAAGVGKTRSANAAIAAQKELEDAERDLREAEQARDQAELQLGTTIEDLRLYLERLYEWSSAFHMGVCAAVVASLGAVNQGELEPFWRVEDKLKQARARKSNQIDPELEQARERALEQVEREFRRARPLGLKTVAAVLEIGKSTDSSAPNAVTGLSSLRPTAKLQDQMETQTEPDAPKSGDTPSILDELDEAILAGERFTARSQSFGSFAEEPKRIEEWLGLLTNDVKALTHDLSKLAVQSKWQELADNYWPQWQWPPTGAIVRSSAVSALDLIYTTRHGSIPVVPTGGGYLSICQWSRIVNLSMLEDHGVPSHVLDAAAGNLNIPELVGKSSGEARLDEPVAAIRPLSSNTPAWTWTPQTQVKAIGLMPGDVAEADRKAIEARAGVAIDIHDPIVDRIRSMRLPSPVGVLEFVEMRDSPPEDTGTESRWLARAAQRIYFGYRASVSGTELYIASPGDVHDLVDKARSAYEDFFPVTKPPRSSIFERLLFGWLTLWDTLRAGIRRVVRSYQRGMAQLRKVRTARARRRATLQQ
jgi:hypothetical protein